MAATDPPPAPPGSHPPLDAFTCPVCLDLLYKPTIASPCAHVTCFWCAHRSMDGLAPSACPLCRARYGHQAAVCAPLHWFIGAAFPAAFADREAEVRAEEAAMGVASMSVPAAGAAAAEEGGGGGAASDSPLSPSAWACAAPACRRLVARPTALLCGHVVCGTTCVPSTRACPACGRVARAAPEAAGSRRGTGDGGGGGSTPPPSSSAAASSRPRPCRLLEEVVGGLFPEAYAARLAEEEEEKKAAGEVEEEEVAAAAAAAAADGEEEPTASPPPPPPRPFTHFGVGCDACGAYPIIGRRFKCTDCPEAIGFDVCGDCVASRGRGGGRFGQGHTPDHELVEIQPVRGLLHLLQEANPELSVAQILALGALARGDGEEGTDEGVEVVVEEEAEEAEEAEGEG